jgi:hypothetical protein
MDANGATSRLHQIILAWDYFRLWDRQAAGQGVYDSLRPVPGAFESIEVRRAGGGGQGRGWVAVVGLRFGGGPRVGLRRGCCHGRRGLQSFLAPLFTRSRRALRSHAPRSTRLFLSSWCWRSAARSCCAASRRARCWSRTASSSRAPSRWGQRGRLALVYRTMVYKPTRWPALPAGRVAADGPLHPKQSPARVSQNPNPRSPPQAGQFLMVTVQVEEELGRRIAENDLLLLSKVRAWGGGWAEGVSSMGVREAEGVSSSLLKRAGGGGRGLSAARVGCGLPPPPAPPNHWPHPRPARTRPTRRAPTAGATSWAPSTAARAPRSCGSRCWWTTRARRATRRASSGEAGRVGRLGEGVVPAPRGRARTAERRRGLGAPRRRAPPLTVPTCCTPPPPACARCARAWRSSTPAGGCSACST